MLKWIKKHSYWSLAIAVLIVAVVAVGAYAWNFRELPISTDTGKWADFATYLSGTVGVAAVVATLVAFIITLRQQQALIKSQDALIEKQDQQISQNEQLLEMERAYSLESREDKLKESENAAVYLIHHFENLINMFRRAPNALESFDPEYLLAVYHKHPAFYSAFLLENDAEVAQFIDKLDSKLARYCIGSIVNAKHFYYIISYNIDQMPADERNVFRVRMHFKNQVSSERVQQALESVKFGLRDCESFMKEAQKILTR